MKVQKNRFAIYNYFKFYVIVLFLIGINKGFIKKSSKTLFCFKMYSILITFTHIILNVITTFDFQFNIGLFWNMLFIFETSCAVINNVFFEDELLDRILVNLRKLDVMLKIKRKSFQTIKIFINCLIFIVFLYRGVLSVPTFITKNVSLMSKVSLFSLHASQLVLDMGIVWRMLLIMLVHQKLKFIKKNLKNIFTDSNNLIKVALLHEVITVSNENKVKIINDLIDAYATVSCTSRLISKNIGFLVS